MKVVEYPGVTTEQQKVDVSSLSVPPAAVARPELLPDRWSLARCRSLLYRLEAAISRLSVKNNFWHRLCSWIWLPLAFRSGIKIQKGSAYTFTAVLPFRRFNRNWYSAMAGAALLGNAEVAGGMYVFGRCGGDYTVVCKSLSYKFLRPCVGPAVYRIESPQDVQKKVEDGSEFNITLDMSIVQMVQAKHEKERRVGQCTATYHVTPKVENRRRRFQRRFQRQGITR